MGEEINDGKWEVRVVVWWGGRKYETKMRGGEGSSIHGSLHRGNIREWDRGERTEKKRAFP
jgi:hypothetical protein